MNAPRASLGRIIVTPIILMVAGFLIYSLVGAAIGAVIGIVYILWASRRT